MFLKSDLSGNIFDRSARWLYRCLFPRGDDRRPDGEGDEDQRRLYRRPGFDGTGCKPRSQNVANLIEFFAERIIVEVGVAECRRLRLGVEKAADHRQRHAAPDE